MDCFTCFMCFEDLNEAHFCPKCSKLGCKDCLEKWLNSGHNECPHCRATIAQNDIIPCRWMNQLAEEYQRIVQENDNLKCQLDIITLEDPKKSDDETEELNLLNIEKEFLKLKETELEEKGEKLIQDAEILMVDRQLLDDLKSKLMESESKIQLQIEELKNQRRTLQMEESLLRKKQEELDDKLFLATELRELLDNERRIYAELMAKQEYKSMPKSEHTIGDVGIQTEVIKRERQLLAIEMDIFCTMKLKEFKKRKKNSGVNSVSKEKVVADELESLFRLRKRFELEREILELERRNLVHHKLKIARQRNGPP